MIVYVQLIYALAMELVKEYLLREDDYDNEKELETVSFIIHLKQKKDREFRSKSALAI